MRFRAQRFNRNPDDFPGEKLLVKDFDGTVAQTFEQSPSGKGVHEAYEDAIRKLFGSDALLRYKQAGGLLNRSPLEVASGVAPDARGDELRALAQTITKEKLEILMGSIGMRLSDGERWPRPMPGYLRMRKELERIRRMRGVQIDDLILSSGHEEFIEKVFRMWGTDQPTHIVATETMEDRGLEMEVKPSRALMDTAYALWLESFGMKPGAVHYLNLADQTMYVGDDEEKDGQLAYNSGIENFALINLENSAEVWAEVTAWIRGDKKDGKK